MKDILLEEDRQPDLVPEMISADADERKRYVNNGSCDRYLRQESYSITSVPIAITTATITVATITTTAILFLLLANLTTIALPLHMLHSLYTGLEPNSKAKEADRKLFRRYEVGLCGRKQPVDKPARQELAG